MARDARRPVLSSRTTEQPIDLALHVCVDDALGTPASPAEAFALLAGSGRIDATLAEQLAAAAGLRNLIVYRYGDLDMHAVADVIERDLDHLMRYVALLAD